MKSTTRLSLVTGLSAGFLFWIGCEEGDGASRILTISYNNDYQPSSAENSLIIHSNKGKVLATKSMRRPLILYADP